MTTTQEIIANLESEINPTGTVGMQIQTLAARLDYATKIARASLENLKNVYESAGNDYMADLLTQEIQKLNTVLP